MFKSNSGRYYIAGIKRFIPQAKGEWVEDEESEDRFMDGYGMLFEDFRASKREHDAANEIVEREERERRREELIITDWITQQREEEEEEGEDEYEQNNAAARAARKRIRTDNVVVEKKNRQCEDSEDSDAEAGAFHSSHQACMFQAPTARAGRDESTRQCGARRVDSSRVSFSRHSPKTITDCKKHHVV